MPSVEDYRSGQKTKVLPEKAWQASKSSGGLDFDLANLCRDIKHLRPFCVKIEQPTAELDSDHRQLSCQIGRAPALPIVCSSYFGVGEAQQFFYFLQETVRGYPLRFVPSKWSKRAPSNQPFSAL